MPLVWRRRGVPGTAFVLMLVLCLFAFAIYLKASIPSLSGPGSSQCQVKFWVKNAASQNTKVKLAMVDAYVLVPPAPVFPVQGSGSSWRPVLVSTLPLKDTLAELGHWFRPPPLS